MTVSTTHTSVLFTGDGTNAALAVSFNFKGTGTSAELEVIQITTATGARAVMVNPTDYVITGGSGSTGTCTVQDGVTDYTSSHQWLVRRKTTKTQTLDLPIGTSHPSDAIEKALDRITMIQQEVSEDGVPRGYQSGMALTVDTDTSHDISMGIGVVRDFADTSKIENLVALVKRIDAAWAVGTGNGGYGSASGIAADTWYHYYAIRNLSAGVVDAGFDASVTATQLLSDSGYDIYRLRGSVLTDSSSNILGFTQVGQTFIWDDTVEDIDTTQSESAALLALTQVPTGRRVKAWLNVVTDAAISIQTPDADNEQASATDAPLSSVNGSGQIWVWTDTSSQIQASSVSGGASIQIAVLGWYDPLGEND